MDDDVSRALSRRRLLQASAGLLAASQTVLNDGAKFIAEAEAGGGASLNTAAGTVTVADYILQRLKLQGVTRIFGVPGKTCEAIYERAHTSGIDLVVTSSDLEAGYAADGYARVTGLGVACVTYGVGTLSLINAIAGAYAERSPVIVINGGPGMGDLNLQLREGVSFSHSSGRRRHATQKVQRCSDGRAAAALSNNELLVDLAMFEKVTAYAERADTAAQVPRIVDEAIAAALSEKRPAYIEISKDVWSAAVPRPAGAIIVGPQPSGSERAVARDIMSELKAARAPLVMFGIEIQRYGLASAAETLVRKLGLPWTTTLLAKSVIPENTPGFIGVYDGTRAPPFVRDIVKDADHILALGCMFGIQYRQLFTGTPADTAPEKFIRVAERQARFKGRDTSVTIDLEAIIAELNRQPFQAPSTWRQRPGLPGLTFAQRRASQSPRAAVHADEPGLTYDYVMNTVSDRLDETFVAITDTSLSTYPAADLDIKGAQGFMCNALWQSIGFSPGAAVGAGLAPNARRPLVVCGDGGFQMTVQALSTLARRNIPAIVIVLDNSTYAIEQWLIDPSYYTTANKKPLDFLMLQPWAYEKIAVAMGFAETNAVQTATEDAFAAALTSAKQATGPFFIRAMIKPHDIPSELRPA